MVDSETGKANKAEKSITSPNRFEKLENLDPDIDDSVLEPSSSIEALKGSSSKSSDAEKKRDRDRSSGGGSGISSSTANHRGRKSGNIIYHRGVKGHSSDPEMAGKVRNHEGTSKTTGKNELVESSELHSSKGKRDKSEFRRTSSNDSRSLDIESDLNESRYTDTSPSINSKNTTTSTSGIEAGPSHESLSCTEEQLDLSQDALEARRKMEERTSYSRVSS